VSSSLSESSRITLNGALARGLFSFSSSMSESSSRIGLTVSDCPILICTLARELFGFSLPGIEVSESSRIALIGTLARGLFGFSSSLGSSTVIIP
jgi:hypothetical protein